MVKRIYFSALPVYINGLIDEKLEVELQQEREQNRRLQHYDSLIEQRPEEETQNT